MDIKETLHQHVEEITMDNFEEKEIQIRRYLKWIKYGLRNDFMESPEPTELPLYSSPPTMEELLDDYPPEEEIAETAKQEMYFFERKLLGGMLPELEAFVPETTVRELGLEHGDYVQATPIETPDTSRRQWYEYTLAATGEPRGSSHRVQLDHVVLKREFGELMVTDAGSGDLLHYQASGDPIVIRRENPKGNSLQAQDGDVVSVAYYVDKEEPRILWIYDSSPAARHTRTKKKGAYKSKETAAKTADCDLGGNVIAIVGKDEWIAQIEETIERNNGRFLHIETNASPQTTAASVGHADVIIVDIEHTNHNKSQEVFAHAKEYRRPIRSISNMGQSGILRTAHELIQELEDHTHE